MDAGEGQEQDRVAPPKKTFGERLAGFFANPKKRLIFIITVIIIIMAIFGAGFYFLRHGTNTPKPAEPSTSQTSTSTPETPKTFANVLDGLMVDKDSADRHPLAVIVENHTDARPQAGLNKASIVYEAIAEGGITRFLALFSTYNADKVGPVRSMRTYFVDWAHGYNAFIAHVGGNIDALDKIKAEKSLDLDEFAYTMPYWREYQAGLATEHTMYASTTKLREQAAKNGYPTANNFTIYKFKDDPVGAEAAALPASQRISIDFSESAYNVYFDYDKTTNSYKRFLAGKPHVDQISKDQLNPKNVIVMTVKRKAIKTRINEQGYDMTTIGSGVAKIFLDGKAITGTWKKTGTADREIFYDETGKEITFNRGQFWICVIPPESTVTVQ